jgi:hypothetical protein
LFFEIKRILKDDGYAIIHLCPFSYLPKWEQSWEKEVAQQVGRAPSGHWHHFYSSDELYYVLSAGTGFSHVHVAEHGAWVCFSKTPFRLPSGFDPEVYLKYNPDLRRSWIDPTEHYRGCGHRHGCRWR